MEEETSIKLTQARQQDDPDLLAEALALHANTLLEAGEIRQARIELDEAAQIHRQQGRVYDEARLRHLAATLCRFEGQLDEAKKRAKRAAQLAAAGTPIAVSAATELGEIALAEHKGEEAAQAYSKALVAGEAAGLVEMARATLLRKRAIAWVMSSHYQKAVKDLELAHELLLQVGEQTTAIRVLVEKASALQQSGDVMAYKQTAYNAMQIAKAVSDHHAQADLYLLQATHAVEHRHINAALLAAQNAQRHSLLAVAPTSYISATVAIAELAEANGDRLTAYEALAVGWVTLADLLGRDLAKTTFKPKLLSMRQRWGATSFATIKSAYEAKQRAAKKNLTTSHVSDLHTINHEQ